MRSVGVSATPAISQAQAASPYKHSQIPLHYVLPMSDGLMEETPASRYEPPIAHRGFKFTHEFTFGF